MENLFWILFGLVLYCYLGYPILIYLIARAVGRPIKKGRLEPSLSVILSVYNEEDVIYKKITNILSLDYPEEKIEIIIGSDGSTDKTNQIIREFQNPRIILVESQARRGKMATINDLVLKAKGDILIFSDARQEFEYKALRELVANFNDPKVGCVSGELVFSRGEGATSKGINLYWNYEKFIRSQESRVHSMLGATGAIYAIRKSLYVPVPQRVVLDDMFIPLKIVGKGYRAIFDETAKAYDEVAESPKEEHRRKARTLFGNYQIFGILGGAFNPLKSPVAFQLFSHKFLRVVMPFALIGLIAVNWALIPDNFYTGVFAAQLAFYAMAVVGGLARYEKHGILGVVSKVCYVPYVFCLLNFSALAGFARFIGKGQEAAWEKARG